MLCFETLGDCMYSHSRVLNHEVMHNCANALDYLYMLNILKSCWFILYKVVS